MGFFDKVKNAAGNAVNSISDTGKEFTEKARINKALKNEEAKINNLYFTMGQKLFNDNETAPAGYEEFFESIKASKNEMEKLNQELMILNSNTACPNCGTKFAEGQQFCRGCGTNLAEAMEKMRQQQEQMMQQQMAQQQAMQQQMMQQQMAQQQAMQQQMAQQQAMQQQMAQQQAMQQQMAQQQAMQQQMAQQQAQAQQAAPQSPQNPQGLQAPQNPMVNGNNPQQ